MTERWDTLLIDCRLATLRGDTPYGAIENAALGWKDGTIAFAGSASALPGPPDALAARVARTVERMPPLARAMSS